MIRPIPSDVTAAARAADKRWGVFASVSLAQWALESAWGEKLAGKCNPFGIKALADQAGTMCETHEVVDGKTYLAHCRFRDFSSLAEAFDAHARLIATGAPYAAAMQAKHDLPVFVARMAEHYATDPEYASKLMAIIKGQNLERFDLRVAE